MQETVKIVRAFQPGDVVFLEVPGSMSADAEARMREMLDHHLKGTDIRVIILGDGIRVAGREEHLERSEG